MKWKSIVTTAAVTIIVSIWGCERQVLTPMNTASARLISSNGENIGRATLAETEQGVRLHIEVDGLEPGVHELQALDAGACELPHFAAPGDKAPATLGTVEVDETGEASIDLTLEDLSLASDDESTLMNKSLIITTQDGLGARIACGVVESEAVESEV